MIKYLAKYCPDPKGRRGNSTWKALYENKKRKWNWSQRHTWQSWREHYVKDQVWFDRKIRQQQQKNPASEPAPPPSARPPSSQDSVVKRERVPFTALDDEHLMKYLAEHAIMSEGILGRKLYEDLVENVDRWPWASRHPAQSWRERYSRRREQFNQWIERYQRDNPEGATLEAFSPSQKRRRKLKKADRREDEDEDRDEQEEQEQVGGEEKERMSALAREEHEVEEAIQAEDSDQVKRADGPSRSGSAPEHAGKKRRRSSVSNDETEVARGNKRRRGDEHIEDGVPATAAEGFAKPVQRAAEVEPVRAREDERTKRANQKLAENPPSDDYTGDIFEPSVLSRSDSETEDEDEQVMDHPPIAVQREEEEEAEEEAEADEEEEDQEDQLDASDTGSGKGQRMDVDVAVKASAEQQPNERPSAHGAPTPTVAGRARTPPSPLYPSLSSVPPPTMDVDAPSLPGQFPATSTSVGDRDASVASVDIPLAHEILAKAQATKRAVLTVSQNPTPPASSPPVEDRSLAKSREASPVLQRPVAVDTTELPQPGPSTAIDTTSRPPPRTPKAKNKYLRKQSEDPFTSVTTTPVIHSSRDTTPSTVQPRERRHRRPREPPRLIDGPYNHAFTDAMGRTPPSGSRATGVVVDEDIDSEEWPPRRGRSKGKAKARQDGMKDRTPIVPAKVKTEPQHPAIALRPPCGPPARAHHIFSQPTQESRASQYPQAQPSPSQHHVFSQPTQQGIEQRCLPPPVQEQATEAETMPSFRLPKKYLDHLERALTKHSHLLQSNTADAEDDVITSTPVRRPSQRGAPVPGPSSVGPIHADDVSRSLELGRSVRFDPSLPDIKGKARDYGPSPSPVHNRRHASGGDVASQALLEGDSAGNERVRVRQSLPVLPTAPHGVRSADDSFVGTTSTSFSFRRPRRRESLSFVHQPKPRSASVEPEPAIQISEDDESVVVHIGVETAIQTMSENHGFNSDIVRRVWSQTQSLRMADVVLGQMREAAEKAALQFLEQLQEEGQGAAEPDAKLERQQPHPARSESPRRPSYHDRESPTLHITPVEANDDTSPEYSPPKPTRAGQFLRLVKEGRVDEALAREFSYAAGISPSQTPLRSGPDVEVHRLGMKPASSRFEAQSQDEQRSPVRYDEELREHSPDIPRWKAATIAMGKRFGQMLGNVDE
ncbi:hypothetical protein EVJ58_g3628 [Rhodofomes roseus]|uniref:TERF2-interacting telomeric protein 1 Myb domain-containing protein n=1 Tax=Rhodofomes roseus TaxID=34475 RepID=A0A4Y9YMH9_9APHY|nr:hypothetical protein EVJ58_g3628 [Rhodofomes roseus]